MVNLIRMNLLKLVRMKAFYILTLITAFICVVLIADNAANLTVMLDDSMSEKERAEMIELQEELEAEGPSTVGATFEEDTSPAIADYTAEFFRSGLLTVLLAIFVVLYVCSERDSGFLKNLCVCTEKRWHIVAARMASVLAFLLVQVVVVFLSMLVTNVVFGSCMEIGNLLSAFPVLMLQILLHLALSAFVFAVVELIRNNSVSMIVSMFISFGFGSAIVFGCTEFIRKLTSVNIPLAEYLISTRIKMISSPLEYSVVPVTIVIGVVGLIGYLAVSSFIFQKRDLY